MNSSKPFDIQDVNLITLAIPIFFILILCEYLYGVIAKNNTYRLNDAFSSISLGMISRLPVILNLGILWGLTYNFIVKDFNLGIFQNDHWTTWAVAFLLYDLSYYWMHRLSHEIKILWASHVVHHQSEEYNLSTALRQTGTGFLFTSIFYIPMILLGIPLKIFITVAAINLIYQFWVHTEHIKKIGFIELVFVTPSHHRVHHAQNPEYVDTNHGGVFIIWDKLFGTFVEERSDLKPIYGTVKPLRSWNPIWANFEIFHQMFKDAIYTKKITDKIKLWFSATGWRPDDVVKRFPSQVNDLTAFKKYDPAITKEIRIFAFLQFLIINVISTAIIFTLNDQTYTEKLIFAVILILSVTSISMLLENIKGSYGLEFARSIVVVALFFTNILEPDLLASKIILAQGLFNIICIAFLIPIKRQFQMND